jgi:hypothetical protein
LMPMRILEIVVVGSTVIFRRLEILRKSYQK